MQQYKSNFFITGIFKGLGITEKRVQRYNFSQNPHADYLPADSAETRGKFSCKVRYLDELVYSGITGEHI